MKNRKWILKVLLRSSTAATLLTAVSACVTTTNIDPAVSNADIRVVRINSQKLLVRTVKGTYAAHGQEILKVMQVAKSQNIDLGNAVGIYPDDPDVVGASEARWKIGFALKKTTETPPRMPEPLSIEELVECDAAVLHSTLQNSNKDGLRMLAWLPHSGYVQVAPTRIEYADFVGGQNSTLRIVVPVRKREQKL